VKILFSALHFGYFRNFESTIVELVRRGHRVHIAADEPDAFGGESLVERLAGQYPEVTFGYAPSLDPEAWFRVARKLRIGFDYVRFHDGVFADFRKTRAHLADRIPRGLLRLLATPVVRGRGGRRALMGLLWALEQLMPVSEASCAFIERHDPDVVLLASVTAWRAPQIDHLRAARALGRRVGICVFSWDHLSSKALLRMVPDRVFVWNETQKKEAVSWHHMPADRVVVTGAQCYDQWFDRGPSRDRTSFCRAVGLSPGHPILLYVCSVMTPDPCESRFVLRWIEEIRRSADPCLREAGILVRPHPERTEEWEGVSLERFGNAVLYGRNPLNPDAQADYFDSLYHSHAVVGIVTSAFLEAAIVGRPVHTLLPPEFAMYQEGVQHFRYLMEVEGGILKMTRSFADHLAGLASAVGQVATRDEQNSRFVRAFVRPQGLDVAATPALVAAIEDMAIDSPLPAVRRGVWHRAAQPLARALVQSADEGWLRAAMRDTREMERDVTEAAKEAAKAEHKEAAARQKAERYAEKTRVLETRRRERRREQRTGARRKQIARLKGVVKALVGLSS
jgi:hypothetical protein